MDQRVDWKSYREATSGWIHLIEGQILVVGRHSVGGCDVFVSMPAGSENSVLLLLNPNLPYSSTGT